MRRIELCGALMLFVALGGMSVPASAQQTPPVQSKLTGLKLSGDQPIEIESDKLEVKEAENLAIFTGNVNVTQGPTLLKTSRMTVYYATEGGGSAATGSSNIDRLEVDGKVYVKSDKQVATGDSGVFNMKTETLVLSGKEVVLSEGNNVLMGCKLTVQMKTGQAQVEGCNQRVKMSIVPGSNKKN